MKVECLPGMRMGKLHRVIENRDQGSPDTVVIHVGINNFRRNRNLDYVTGNAYDLVNMAKIKPSTSRVVLGGMLQRRDMSWHCIGAVNSRYEWVAKTLGVTFVDPNNWVDDWNSGGDGLHIN